MNTVDCTVATQSASLFYRPLHCHSPFRHIPQQNKTHRTPQMYGNCQICEMAAFNAKCHGLFLRLSKRKLEITQTFFVTSFFFFPVFAFLIKDC